MKIIFALAAVAALSACDPISRQAVLTLGCPVGMVLVAEVENQYDPIPEINSTAGVEAICVPKAAVEAQG